MLECCHVIVALLITNNHKSTIVHSSIVSGTWHVHQHKQSNALVPHLDQSPFRCLHLDLGLELDLGGIQNGVPMVLMVLRQWLFQGTHDCSGIAGWVHAIFDQLETANSLHRLSQVTDSTGTGHHDNDSIATGGNVDLDLTDVVDVARNFNQNGQQILQTSHTGNILDVGRMPLGELEQVSLLGGSFLGRIDSTVHSRMSRFCVDSNLNTISFRFDRGTCSKKCEQNSLNKPKHTFLHGLHSLACVKLLFELIDSCTKGVLLQNHALWMLLPDVLVSHRVDIN